MLYLEVSNSMSSSIWFCETGALFGNFICRGLFVPKEEVPAWGAHTAGVTKNWFSL
jgi:hypothetical protein